MGSCRSAGRSAERRLRIKKSTCEDSPDGKHSWIVHKEGQPSEWSECEYCDRRIYRK